MNQQESYHPIPEVFNEIRAGYEQLESYIHETFDHLLEANSEAAANVSDDEWMAERASLMDQLQSAKRTAEGLATTLEEKETEIAERQAAWDEELSGLRELVEAKMAESQERTASSDAVVNSVLNTFANLKK